MRHYTLIHYVVKGKGIFYARGQAHPVHAGQAFLILPGEVTTYTADREDPWHYRWIGFDGKLAERFTQLPPVFPVSDAYFPSAMLPQADSPLQEYHIAGLLLQMYAELFSQRNAANQHVKKVKSYIRTSYMHSIRVDEIARQLNLDRRYLSRLFHRTTGQTIQEYLIRTRLKEAARCLQQGISVHDAATMCGYEDVSNFSKMFKRHYGVSPAHWKAE